MALAYLNRFGVVAEAIHTPEDLGDPMLNMQRYEQERPTPDQACRQGDERVLLSGAFEVRLPQVLDQTGLQVDVDYRGKY